jgi:hypothetical protein
MPLPEGADIVTLTLKPLVDAFHLTREVSYGALVLLIWDMSLTFADEVGTKLPHSFFILLRGTDETFPIGQLDMVCEVGHYKCPVSRQSLCRAGDDFPWNLGYASGHVFAGEGPY